MIYVGSAGWNIPRVHKTRFPADGSQLRRFSSRLKRRRDQPPYSPQQLDALANRLRPPAVDAWCIFDNTGSGSAAGNALDLLARVTK